MTTVNITTSNYSIIWITITQKINKEVKLKRKLSQKLIESSVTSPSTPGASSRKYFSYLRLADLDKKIGLKSCFGVTKFPQK